MGEFAAGRVAWATEFVEVVLCEQRRRRKENVFGERPTEVNETVEDEECVECGSGQVCPTKG